MEFATARAARDAKRKKLQKDPLKRKVSASALTSDEYKKIIEMWDENTPDGLHRKFFHIVSHKLAWRGLKDILRVSNTSKKKLIISETQKVG